MIKKDAPQPSVELDHGPKSWEENPLVELLSKYGMIALTALLGIVAAAFLAYKVSTIGTEKAEINYLNANKDFLVFSQPAKDAEAATSENALGNLQTYLDKYPELHAKYDGLIAQTLLNQNEFNAAAPYANRAISRTEQENTPYYTAYAKNSLVIAQGQYDNALTQAQALDQQMRDSLQQNPSIEQKDFGTTLFALNLLRIATLQNKLGQTQNELKTWQDWQAFSKADKFPILAKAFQDLRTHFSEGNVSLDDYIDARIATLKSK